MGVIFRRKDSAYWWIAYTKGDVRVRESSKTASKTLATEILRHKEARALLSPEKPHRAPETTLESFLEDYLDWVRANRRAHTLRSYSSVLRMFNAYLKGVDNIKCLSDVTLKVLEDYKQHRLSVAKTGTLKNHVIVLKAFFNKAVEWGYLSESPAKRIKAVEITDSKPIRYLSEEEYKRFMEVCKRDFKPCYPMFYTFIHTGLRKGELLSLEWPDIEFAKGLIHIRSKEGFRPKGISRKSGKAKERVIPIHENLVKVLLKLPRDSGPIFGKFSDNMPRRLLMRIAKKAGIKGLTRLHELRHSYATFLLNKGVDIYKIKELLGHSDIRDTMRYAHLPTVHMKKDVKQLESLDS